VPKAAAQKFKQSAKKASRLFPAPRATAWR